MSSKKKSKDHVDISTKALADGFVSMRSIGKPLRQPAYSFRDVPRCARDLSGSVVEEVTNRDHFNDRMAEMVLLCNEAMRRNAERSSHNGAQKGKSAKKTSKPLSLEYIADRLDVDDPVVGFFVRTANPNAAVKGVADKKISASSDAPSNVSAGIDGMMQGFVTITTFTNWQKTFRFDSMHDSAFAFDDANLAEGMLNGRRKCDRNGELAEELQATVRCGDPYNEGIVWPRIAEISLLGALGCGKALLELVIERLESMSATKTQNYDFVVLQATDNSVPFYEAHGFVRVGCVTEDEKFGKNEDTSSVDENDIQSTPDLLAVDTDSSLSAVEQQSSEPATKLNDTAAGAKEEPPNKIASSAIFTYITTKPYEKVCDIARRFKVDSRDIIFLNKDVYQDLVPSSYLMRDTSLFIPAEQARFDATSNALQNQRKYNGKSRAVQWYFSEDNESPKEIAKKFNVKCRDLIKANGSRIADLQPSSRLIENTRIQVSHLHVHNDQHVPYCHWTFPDDTLETSEPSYMMARKLNRRKRGNAKIRPVESSFPAKVIKYEPPAVFAESKPDCSGEAAPESAKKQKGAKKRKRHPDEPIPPKRPANPFMFFCSEIRATMVGKPASEVTKVAAEQWKNLPDVDKCKYKDRYQTAKIAYTESYRKHTLDMETFRKANPEWVAEQERISSEKKPKPKTTLNLFNKVVKLNSDGVRQAGDEFKYYFVLTYLPDLQWCHLAPLRTVGTYGKDKPKAEGRPIWMLVDENEGKELDISAGCCEIVKSRATKHNEDADREQWDVPESGPPVNNVAPLAAIFTVNAKAEEPSPVGSSKAETDAKDPGQAEQPAPLETLISTSQANAKAKAEEPNLGGSLKVEAIVAEETTDAKQPEQAEQPAPLEESWV